MLRAARCENNKKLDVGGSFRISFLPILYHIKSQNIELNLSWEDPRPFVKPKSHVKLTQNELKGKGLLHIA